MAVVVGLDPSTRALAFTITRSANQRVPEMVKIRLPQERADACAVAFRETAQLLLDLREQEGYKTDIYVYQEAPVVGRGGPHPTIAQSQVGGAVMAAVAECGGFLTLVNNQTWKKSVLGNGGLDKATIATMMGTVWPQAHHAARGDQDLIDSAAINRFGNQRVKLRLALKQRTRRK